MFSKALALKNKNDLSYLSYKIHACTNRLNFTRLESVKYDLFLINQKLFLIDLLVDKDSLNKEIVAKAEEYYKELISADTKDKKLEIFEKVSKFIEEVKGK